MVPSSPGRLMAVPWPWLKRQGIEMLPLVLYMMETGEKDTLTKTTKNFPADSCPAFSPDGRTLAFCRWVDWDISDLYLLDLSRDLKPVGEPRRLTSQNLPIPGSGLGFRWKRTGIFGRRKSLESCGIRLQPATEAGFHWPGCLRPCYFPPGFPFGIHSLDIRWQYLAHRDLFSPRKSQSANEVHLFDS